MDSISTTIVQVPEHEEPKTATFQKERFEERLLVIIKRSPNGPVSPGVGGGGGGFNQWKWNWPYFIFQSVKMTTSTFFCIKFRPPIKHTNPASKTCPVSPSSLWRQHTFRSTRRYSPQIGWIWFRPWPPSQCVKRKGKPMCNERWCLGSQWVSYPDTEATYLLFFLRFSFCWVFFEEKLTIQFPHSSVAEAALSDVKGGACKTYRSQTEQGSLVKDIGVFRVCVVVLVTLANFKC